MIDCAKRSRRSAAERGASNSFRFSGLYTVRLCPPLLPSSTARPECITHRFVPPIAAAPHGLPALFFAPHFIASSRQSCTSKQLSGGVGVSRPFSPSKRGPIATAFRSLRLFTSASETKLKHYWQLLPVPSGFNFLPALLTNECVLVPVALPACTPLTLSGTGVATESGAAAWQLARAC